MRICSWFLWYVLEEWMSVIISDIGTRLLRVSEMSLQYLAVLHCYDLLIVGCACAYLPPAKFSFSNLMKSALPAIQPIVAAGSDRCESLKNMLGVTYEQMLQKNMSLFNEKLNLDFVTKSGNIKYNFTSRRLKRMLRARNIIILIHGYLESSDGQMVNAIAPELMKQNVKLFALDARNVISFEYFRSSTYVRFMGEMLGSLLSDVVKYSPNSTQIHLIGHSLGAHVAAVAGQKVFQDTGQKLYRLTGLDPAGPCFSNVSLDSRLDASDADFVDVIHTNAGILGLNEPVGHKDFYPNNGMSQPGCILSTCDHSRAWELFAESINKPDSFPARKCGNWSLYQNGKCAGNEMSHMGYKCDRSSPGIYYLSTAASAPFGLGTKE